MSMDLKVNRLESEPLLSTMHANHGIAMAEETRWVIYDQHSSEVKKSMAEGSIEDVSDEDYRKSLDWSFEWCLWTVQRILARPSISQYAAYSR